MLSNAYFLAKFRFDTAENEPVKNLQNFCKILQNFAKFANFANPNEDPAVVASGMLGQETARTQDAGSGFLRRAATRTAGPAAPLAGPAPALSAARPRATGGLTAPRLKGSIGEGPNHSNFSDQSSHSILSKFRNFG